MCFGDMAMVAKSFIFIWIISIFILGLCNLFQAIQVKRTKTIVICVIVLIAEYVLIQVISDMLHRDSGMVNVDFTYQLGRIHFIWWVLLVVALMGISITLASFFKHWKEEHITPMSIKDSMDMLHAGICYWEESGRIILSNRRMNEICLALSGEILLNGQKFYESIGSECVSLPDGTIQYFFHDLVEFDDKQVHELVAADITELYKRNELLEQETLSLQRMNEGLRRYNQNIEEMVRKQEILDAKVYIHDEMNRLMLVTTAMTETVTPKEEFESVLTLWRNNAVLLGNEAEKDIEDVDALEIEKLAKLLGIQVTWVGLSLVEAPRRLREMLVVVTREAIANAVKHAEAKHIQIDMTQGDKELLVAIWNDGQEPDGDVKEGGGLSNIRRMIEKHKGSLEIVTKGQFVLHVKIPL